MDLRGLLESPTLPLVLPHMSPSFPLQLQLQKEDAIADVKTECVQVAPAFAAAASSAYTAPADDEQRTWKLENETKQTGRQITSW